MCPTGHGCVALEWAFKSGAGGPPKPRAGFVEPPSPASPPSQEALPGTRQPSFPWALPFPLRQQPHWGAEKGGAYRGRLAGWGYLPANTRCVLNNSAAASPNPAVFAQQTPHIPCSSAWAIPTPPPAKRVLIQPPLPQLRLHLANHQ